MNKFTFKDLNPQQREAVQFSGGNLLLAAGPGSGKTHTMTSRIIYLIECMSVDPSSILVITFTKDAALSMQKRFQNASELSYPVAFGTFHSIFYNMIKEYKKASPPILIFDKNKNHIAENCLRKFADRSFLNDEPDAVKSFIAALSVYKNTADAEKASSELPAKIRSLFPDMLRYYEGIRKKSCQMDFDDMGWDCRQLLIHDESFARRWKGRFSNILIDEFQDICPVQYETVRLLSEDFSGNSKSNVFAVGDDDQSIYGFRGADPSILTRFANEMHAGILHLDTNYRSRKKIVNYSMAVINENSCRIKKDLISASDEEGIVEIKGLVSRDEEYGYIVKKASEICGNKAVLFRTNLEMQSFASYLSSKGIPFTIKEKTESIFEHFIFKDLSAYIKLSQGIYDESDICAIINKPLRYINHEAVIGSRGNLMEIINKLKNNQGIMNPEAKIRNIRLLIKDLEFMKFLSPFYAIGYICQKIGYSKYLYTMAGTDAKKKEEYDRILSIAKEISSKTENYDELDLIKEKYENDLRRSKKELHNDDLLDLMTVHASKGLEFDNVFIPDCNEGIFPHGKLPDKDTISEERRIFYVAMTRAVSGLYLLYIKGRSNNKYVTSRFLNPIIKMEKNA